MRVLYVSNSLFPWGQAYATRIRELAHIFHQLGWDFHALVDYSNDGDIGKFEYGTYRAILQAPTRWSRPVATIIGARQAVKEIDRFQPDLVIIGNLYDRFNRIASACEKRGIPVVLEICEWFTREKWNYRPINPYAYAYERGMTRKYRRAHGAITISTRLDEHFTQMMPTVRIPTVLDLEGLPFSEEPKSTPVRISQIGFAGLRKELFLPIFQALLILTPQEREQLILDIHGPSPAQVEANLGEDAGILQQLTGQVKVHGRVPQQQVPELYRASDFTIFVRPSTHTNNAGFPTKFAESLGAGTPVITNDTGDIGLYLRDGVNGFLTSLDPDEIAHTLRQAIALSPAAHQQMREHARASAHEAFHYEQYVQKFKHFMDVVMGAHQ